MLKPFVQPSPVEVQEGPGDRVSNSLRNLRDAIAAADGRRQATPLWEPLEEVTQDVYASLLGIDVWRAADTESALAELLTAAVYYAGAWKGALVVECSKAQARRWAARLMETGSLASDEDALDGLTELVSTIAGSLKPLLPRGVDLSTPLVVEGAGHRLRLRGGRTAKLEFEDGLGRFRVTLAMERGK
jgi:CheY-specific phosphatase CheX